uniref:Uncharacterized protein n=1 Tax=Tanacetum cinerariifolium TaxID=118510 RepID=A0A6L2MVM4_TANCI|nr:hypothetical protein [Tanacetum cinerariifolium]
MIKRILTTTHKVLVLAFLVPVEDVPIPDDVNISNSEDIDFAHLPKIKIRPDWLKSVLEEDKPETSKPNWIIPPTDLPEMKECHRLLTNQVDLVNLEGRWLVPDVSKPLPLGGDTTRRVALSISKLKAANYLDFRLEELVPSLWIENERDYNISETYGITHWWYKRKDFYITRHNAPSDRSAVRSHMRILSVISIKTFERYGYAFLREIVIPRADYNEYKISEADFKNLHLNDFKDLYLLLLQGKLNHLPGSEKVHLYNAINLWIRNIVIKQHVGDLQLGIESYQTKLNLTEPR